MLLTQKKYSLDLLANKADMADYKPAGYPVVKGPRTSVLDGDLLQDLISYRIVVGGIPYLTMTRPDISFQ